MGNGPLEIEACAPGGDTRALEVDMRGVGVLVPNTPFRLLVSLFGLSDQVWRTYALRL